MKKIYILFAVGLLVCANLYASNTKGVVTRKCGKRPKRCGKGLKIAIMPIGLQMDNRSFSGLKLSPEELVSLFSQKLTTRLTQTHKLDVLAEESGADYLLVGDISKAKLKRRGKFLKKVNCTVTKYKAKFVFNYQLISSSTKQIVLADTAVAKYQGARLSAGRRSGRIWDISIIANSIDDVVEEVVEKIIDQLQLYLMLVVSVQQDGTVVISQGSDKISEGMWLDIFFEGEKFFDYDTKKLLGKDERLVAKVKVERVEPEIIYARVFYGDVSKISKGLICRPGKAKKDCRLLFHVR